MKSPFQSVGVLSLALALYGCGADEGGKSATVFVAASTRDAVEELAGLFAARQPYTIKVHAESSSKLALQITQGAPAHLFLSANEKWADHVRDEGYAQESGILLGNRLVLIVPAGNDAGVQKPADLVGPKVKKVAVAGPNVPAGMYACQALGKLELWEQLEESKRVVSGEDVRMTLAFVERGEVEAGIVYATDAAISKKVVVVHTFDSGLHAPIRYPLVLLKSGQSNAAARAFHEFLLSEEAAGVFRRYGFHVEPGAR
jgi:molybdate transport system substrate-binding protein